MKDRIYFGMTAVILAAGLALGFSAEASASGEEQTEMRRNRSDRKDTISNGVFIGDMNVSGMTAEQAEQAVEEDMEDLRSASITLTVDDASAVVSAGDFGISWTNTDIVQDALALCKSGNIVKRYKDRKDLEHENRVYDLKYEADKEKIREVVRANADKFNKEPEDARVTTENGTFEIVRGENGVEVNTDKSVKKIYKYINNEWDKGDATIELAADVKEPEQTTEELEMITDVLGTATTYYGSSYERNTNVEVGASKINGHLIMPGEVFSVTDAVTPFNEENGYKLAPSYESGAVVDSYGGGICQVSTTLYNAVLKAELEVVERYNHSMIVTYVDPSKDAAIAEGLMDFRFANNTEYPIFIYGYAYGGELSFTIYGHETRDPGRTVEFVSETTGSTTPEGGKLNARGDLPVGYLAQTQAAHQGLTAVLWKYVTENGETTKEQVNSSNYQAVAATYDVGVGTDDPEIAQAIQSAVAANDLATVQAIISGSWKNPNEEESEEEKPKDQSEQDNGSKKEEKNDKNNSDKKEDKSEEPKDESVQDVPEDAQVIDQ